LKILILSINYAPEPTGFAPHVAAFCEYLVKNGHSITVITGFPFSPYWRRWPEYRGRFILREQIHQVEVLRVSHYVPKRAGKVLQRILMEGSFCLTAVMALLRHSCMHWDIIIYVGAQPSIAMLARLMASFYHIPYIVNINDLAARAGADVGILTYKWLEKLLEAFEYAAYSNASGAIVLCDGFSKALIAKGFPKKQIRIICPPVDTNRICPVNNSRFRREHGLLSEDFVILYSGSMGLKQGLLNVVEAAHLLCAECLNVKWILVGDGELRPSVEQRILDYHLDGVVHLLRLQPEDKMSEMFSAANVLLLNQVKNVKDTVIPSKLLTYMAAGRPVLAAINKNSQAAMVIRKAGGGLIIEPEDPCALANGVKLMMSNPKKSNRMAKLNRAYAEQHFDQRKILAMQEQFLLEVVNRTKHQL